MYKIDRYGHIAIRKKWQHVFFYCVHTTHAVYACCQKLTFMFTGTTYAPGLNKVLS